MSDMDMEFPPLLTRPVERLLALLETEKPRILVGLVGVPGAGKSTLAAQLGEAVNHVAGPDMMTVLGMDGFHLSKADLRRLPEPEEALRRRGAPWTFDAKNMAGRLQSVRQGVGCKSVWWPDFQHEIGDPVENVHEIGPATRLVLVEGLYLLHKDDGWSDVRQQFDEHWYLDTAIETAMERLARRHMACWHITYEEAQNRIAANDHLNAIIVSASRFGADWRLVSD